MEASRFHSFQLETVVSNRLSTERKESINALVLSMQYLMDRSDESKRYFSTFFSMIFEINIGNKFYQFKKCLGVFLLITLNTSYFISHI